jgi:hypothetical protein
MRRGIHIAISLIAVLLLARPLDCFASGAFSREAAKCCSKGNCFPRKNADDCCQNTVPQGKQLATAALKSADHSPLIVAMPVDHAVEARTPQITTADLFATVHSPPGSPPSSRLNLPLLI